MNARKPLLILWALLLIIGMPIHLGAEEGVTDTEIHIGQFGPLSGPAKLWADCVYGADIVFKMVNKAGGIHGRKIVYHPLDDSYNPAKTKAGVKQLQETVGIFAWVGGVGTATGMAVKDYLINRNVPWVGPLSGSEVWVTPPVKTIFALYPHYTFSAKVLCRHAVKVLGKKRIAIVYLNDPFGQNGLDGARKALAEYGLELTAAVPVDRNETNMNPATLELRKAEPEVVILWMDPFKSLRLLTLAKQMGLAPQWMSGSMFGDFPQMHKLSKGLIEGMITDNYVQYENKAAIEKYKNALAEFGDKQATWGVSLIAGIGYAEVLVEGLNRTGPDLTREKFIAALESIQNLTGIAASVSYKPFNPGDPSCRYGIKEVYLQQCLPGGETKVITGWLSD
ncbi:MAG: ABC transporter substrate-binding protein [Thermodesulfobacteriota bacterium]